MTYCYWGGRAYGKVNQQCLFRYNRKTVVQHQIGVGISGKFKAFKWEYVGDKQIRTRYYKEIDKDDITRYVKSEEVTDQWLLETQTDKGLENNTCVEYDWLGKGMFNLPPKKLAEKVYKPVDLHPLYNDYGRAWDQHFFNDLITCDLYNPQPWILDNPYEPFVESFKNCKNVVGFKSNMVDWLIGLLGFFVPPESSKNWGIEVTDPHDAYTKNPEICFSEFDHHIGQNRDVEQRLQDLGIEYEYLDLDTNDYAKFFGLERNLPRTGYNRTHIFKEVAPERYEIAEHIVNHYIKDRNLTGWKLEGRIHDKI